MKFLGILVNVGMKGNINIEQNNISNFTTALYLRENSVKQKLNKLVGNANNLLKD